MSTACAIHCLMTPVMAATASLGVFAWVADEGTESILVMVMLTMAVVSLGLGWRQHGRLIAFGWVAVAAALIGTGRILVTTAETPLVATGGMTIALAHLVNANLRRRCIVCRSSTGTDQPGELVTGS